MFVEKISRWICKTSLERFCKIFRIVPEVKGYKLKLEN